MLIAIDNISDEDFLKLQNALFRNGYFWFPGHQKSIKFPTYRHNGKDLRTGINAISICDLTNMLSLGHHWLGMEKDFPNIKVVSFQDYVL